VNSSTTLVVFIIGSLLLTLFAFFLILYVVLQKRRQYKFTLDKQQMEHHYASQLLQSRIEVQEEAFRHFSEEIHDNVGQVLSLTKMQLHRIAEMTTDITIRRNAQQGTELLTQVITDLRSISHTANGGLILTIGLIESIKKEVAYISSAKSIYCNFQVEGEPFALGSEKDLLVFRIIQESLANAIKHGQPDKLEILLKYHGGDFHATVSDNGAGFDMEAVNGGGLGLNNIRLRAGLLQGKLDILSSRETGTTVSLNMPVSNERKNS
jgi:two-component system NarL family sensor kinase